MLEFNETLDKKYYDAEAVRMRIDTRLKHTTKDIPYYDRGVDFDLFTYSTPENSLRMALRDFSPSIVVDTENSRVMFANVTIDISNILNGEKEEN